MCMQYALIIPLLPSLLSLSFLLPTPSPPTCVSFVLSFLSCKPFPSAMSKLPRSLQEEVGPSLCQDRISMDWSSVGSHSCWAFKHAVARACLEDSAP